MKINLISYAKLAGVARAIRIRRHQGQGSKGRWDVCSLGYFAFRISKIVRKKGPMERVGERCTDSVDHRETRTPSSPILQSRSES